MVCDKDFDKAIELIGKSGNILVTTHTKPDGDACGCVAAMCDALTALGKNVRPLMLSAVPRWYEFLFGRRVPVLGEYIAGSSPIYTLIVWAIPATPLGYRTSRCRPL